MMVAAVDGTGITTAGTGDGADAITEHIHIITPRDTTGAAILDTTDMDTRGLIARSGAAGTRTQHLSAFPEPEAVALSAASERTFLTVMRSCPQIWSSFPTGADL